MIFKPRSRVEKRGELCDSARVIGQAQVLHPHAPVDQIKVRCCTGQHRVVEELVRLHDIEDLGKPSNVERPMASREKDEAIESVNEVAGYDKLQVAVHGAERYRRPWKKARRKRMDRLQVSDPGNVVMSFLMGCGNTVISCPRSVISMS
jgi:hypothetical protein